MRILQRAVEVSDDGAWGPRSQAALDRMQAMRGHNDVLLRFLAYRFKFWAFDEFGRGWTRRGADNLLFAAEDN